MRRVLVATALLLAGCARRADVGAAAPADAAADGGEGTLAAIARAEDARRSADVPREARTHRDVVVRRRAARAYARIADDAAREALTSLVTDEDAEVVAWAAYGLGYACKGHEEATVKTLGAELAVLAPPAPALLGARGAAELDPAVALPRAMARCGGPLVEPTLAGLARGGGPFVEPAVLALGDLATRRKRLDETTMTTLVDLAAPRSGAPMALAFYPLSRVVPPETLAARVVDAAKAALAQRGEARLFAIKALARAGGKRADAATALAAVVVDAKGYDAAERAEAARALGTLGEPGHDAAATALGRLVPDRDPIAIQNLLGPSFHVLDTLVTSLGDAAPKKADAALFALAALEAPKAPSPGLARRLAELRCSAALALARGAADTEVLVRCDEPTSEIAERARLASLVRRPLTGTRRAAFRALASSKHLRVREAAVEALTTHPEVGDLGAEILEASLASKKPGLVATAAEVLHTHPERAFVLAAKEKRAALDPRAPPPSTSPAQELAPSVARAIGAALDEPWPEDRFETRMALLDAAASVRHPAAAAHARAACLDANPVVRERAQKALRTLGEPTTACADAPRAPVAAPELDAPVTGPVRVELDTDVGTLVLHLEPELSPVTVARLKGLVASGFFTGVVVHRVVPGFVVQLGDPDGDGYGGSGRSLRCETSPVAFHPLDVGMALAGRDTGSSQFFVTLGPTPHLDGDYARVGRAEGDWASVADGDVVTAARVR